MEVHLTFPLPGFPNTNILRPFSSTPSYDGLLINLAASRNLSAREWAVSATAEATCDTGEDVDAVEELLNRLDGRCGASIGAMRGIALGRTSMDMAARWSRWKEMEEIVRMSQGGIQLSHESPPLLGPHLRPMFARFLHATMREKIHPSRPLSLRHGAHTAVGVGRCELRALDRGRHDPLHLSTDRKLLVSPAWPGSPAF